MDAMHQKFQGFVKNERFERAKPPARRRPISSKWVFAWKPGQAGEVVCRNVRLVAKGFQQKEGIDCLELLSHTLIPSSIRMVAVAVIQCDWSLNRLDIEEVLVQSKIDLDSTCKIPDGCDVLSQERS